VQWMIAEYERAKIIERHRRGKRHAARLGAINVLSGTPYGMLSAPFFLGLCEVFGVLSSARPALTLDAPCDRRFPGLSPLPAPLGQSARPRHGPASGHHAAPGWLPLACPPALLHLGPGERRLQERLER
jgi:hypothetical protein